MKTLKDLYKIGSGPSSSHTMGPEYACKYILNKYKDVNRFEVTLFGSLALTGKGHLTDYIILKTLGENRTTIKFDYTSPVEHPNTMIINAFNDDLLIISQTFVSIGGGSIEIKGVKGSQLEEIYPFKTFSEISQYVKDNNLSYPEIVYKFEGEEIKKYLDEVYEVMESSIINGLNKTGVLPGKLKVERKASILKNPKNENEDAETKYMRIISSYAYAVSEENAGGGKIVTAPTCGACGVLPAVLFYLKQKYDYSKEQIIDALAVASLFGNIIKQNACISGAFAGCQSEIGSACSMAAAASAYLRGYTNDEIEYAAEIAMEHHLGLTCDPVDGLVQIPCIERNAVAALRAIDASTLASFLVSSRKISFDTVINTMYETGKDLNQAYKETSIGGLAKYYKC